MKVRATIDFSAEDRAVIAASGWPGTTHADLRRLIEVAVEDKVTAWWQQQQDDARRASGESDPDWDEGQR